MMALTGRHSCSCDSARPCVLFSAAHYFPARAAPSLRSTASSRSGRVVASARSRCRLVQLSSRANRINLGTADMKCMHAPNLLYYTGTHGPIYRHHTNKGCMHCLRAAGSRGSPLRSTVGREREGTPFFSALCAHIDISLLGARRRRSRHCVSAPPRRRRRRDGIFQNSQEPIHRMRAGQQLVAAAYQLWAAAHWHFFLFGCDSVAWHDHSTWLQQVTPSERARLVFLSRHRRRPLLPRRRQRGRQSDATSRCTGRH